MILLKNKNISGVDVIVAGHKGGQSSIPPGPDPTPERRLRRVAPRNRSQTICNFVSTKQTSRSDGHDTGLGHINAGWSRRPSQVGHRATCF
jgi:hypothetical protein